MSAQTTTEVTAARVQRASWAVFGIFVLNGSNFASWASRLPAVRDRLDLSPAKIGVLLLIGSLGSLISLPLSGLFVERWGARKAVLFTALINATGYLLITLSLVTHSTVGLAASLVVVGFGTGAWDASMNIAGADVEQQLGRTIMPRYHAGFSLGTVIAAGIGAGMAWLDVPVTVHLPIAIGLSLVGVVVVLRWFLPDTVHTHVTAGGVLTGDVMAVDGPTGEPAAAASARSVSQKKPSVFAAWSEVRTLLIGLVVLAAALTEGSANDWLSLAVVDGFGTTNATGALVFGLFVTAMTGMRWFGTRLLDRYGRVAVLRGTTLLSLTGLAMVALVPTSMLPLAAVGAVLWGMGAALGFPVGMSAASDQPARAAARVAVVSTIGYTAFLAGPALLGLLANHLGYRHALLAVAVPAIIALLVIPVTRPLPKDQLADVPERSAAPAA